MGAGGKVIFLISQSVPCKLQDQGHVYTIRPRFHQRGIVRETHQQKTRELRGFEELGTRELRGFEELGTRELIGSEALGTRELIGSEELGTRELIGSKEPVTRELVCSEELTKEQIGFKKNKEIGN